LYNAGFSEEHFGGKAMSDFDKLLQRGRDRVDIGFGYAFLYNEP
jgi:hypothetical protein